jgi:S1-C subfamily serine protease
LITSSDSTNSAEARIVNRLASAIAAAVLTTLPILICGATAAAALLPPVEPYVTLLELHPVESGWGKPPRPDGQIMPQIIRQGTASAPNMEHVEVPVVQTPSQSTDEDPLAGLIGKAGTGFFINADGTLLTAAHVATSCGRMQIISKYVPRSWVTLAAADPAHDIALLSAPGVRSPSFLHLSNSAPSSQRLRVLGFPASANLIVPAATWAVVENQKFPPNIGPMANPRALLWVNAPEVTHGYSGGPIFDPKLGAVVGILKGAVDGGYLRLVQDMPTTGMAVGPGVDHIHALLRREGRSVTTDFAEYSGEAGDEILRRATVHVLCWH